MTAQFNDRARRLRNALEPVTAGAYSGSGLTINMAAELHRAKT